jgi:ABC-2 type transport system ATP-binding protein
MEAKPEEAAIVCVGLTKAYDRGAVALDGVTLTIDRGVAFGLLGENGAGKSTLVRLIMGFIFPTAGRVSVLGEEQMARAHPRIGYTHEHPIFEPRFTGRAYLTYLGELAGLWGATNRARVAAALDQVDLHAAAGRRIGTYSKGMLQRLAIAQALLTDPELLILDEPTGGLDPRSQWEVRQIVTALRRQGKTILLCSHYLAEVEALCDAVGILHRGRLVQQGAVADLLRAQDAVDIVLAGNEPASAVVARLGLATQVIEVRAHVLRIPAVMQTPVLAALVAATIPIRSLNPVSQTLEDVYIRTTGAAREPSPPSPGGAVSVNASKWEAKRP